MAQDDDVREALQSLESRVAELEGDLDARSARSALYGAAAVVSVLAIFLPLFEGSEDIDTLWEAVGRGSGLLAVMVVVVVAVALAMAAVGFHSPGLLSITAVGSIAFAVILLLKPGTEAGTTLAPVSVTAVVLYFLTALTSAVQAIRQ